MNENWDDYRVFIALAEAGSLLQAGKNLGIQHSTVLRRINALEERLSVRLFERLKTGYVLTVSGEKMLETVQHLKDEIYHAERVVLGEDVKLSGTIKISTTDTIGYFWLPKKVTAFKEQYPDITLDIDITTRHTNLTKREADIAIPAINRQPDYMIGRELEPLTFKLYAHLGYEASDIQPEDYRQHEFLLLNDQLAGLPTNIFIRKHIDDQQIVTTADKLTGLYHFCRNGLGIAALPTYVGDPDPNLKCVGELPSSIQTNKIWILTHPDLKNTARIKAFMEFMRKNVQKNEPDNKFLLTKIV
jgi:DNA-binding transcriptional LysR family regulator